MIRLYHGSNVVIFQLPHLLKNSDSRETMLSNFSLAHNVLLIY